MNTGGASLATCVEILGRCPRLWNVTPLGSTPTQPSARHVIVRGLTAIFSRRWVRIPQGQDRRCSNRVRSVADAGSVARFWRSARSY